MRLERLHDLHLVLRRYPCEDAVIQHVLLKLFGIHLIDLRAGNALGNIRGDIQLLGDGKGRDLMVARDHGHIDARVMTFVHGFLHAFLGRIDHGAQPYEDHVFFLRNAIPFPVGQGQHPERFGTHDVRRLGGKDHVLVGDFPYAVLIQDAVAADDDGIDGALGVGNIFDFSVPFHPVQGGHHLPAGIKRNLIKAGDITHDIVIAQLFIFRVLDERGFRGIADLLAGLFGIFRVVAGEKTFQQSGEDFTVRRQFFRFQRLAGKIPLHHRHPVLGQGARLIGTDDIHRAQGFHRVDLLHDGVAFAHLLDARRQHQRYHGGQPFRDDRHGKGDGDHQGFNDRGAVNKNLAGEHHNTQDHARDAQHLGDAVQILLQRRLLFLDLVQHAGNLADLGMVADLFHHALAAAVFHQGGHEGLVLAVAEGRLLIAGFGAVLLHRNAFARQGRFIHLQGTGLHQGKVRRHHAPRFQDHVIARHQFRRGDLRLHAVPDHHRRGRIDLPQGLHGFLRRKFLHGADDHVGQHHHDDNDAVHDFPGHDGNDRGSHQQKQQRRRKLLRDHGKQTLLLSLGQYVLSLLRPFQGFGSG